MALSSSELEQAHNMGQADYAKEYRRSGKPWFGPPWFALYMSAGLGQRKEDWEEFAEAYKAGWDHAEWQFTRNERRDVYKESRQEPRRRRPSNPDYSYSGESSHNLEFALILILGAAALMAWGIGSAYVSNMRENAYTRPPPIVRESTDIRPATAAQQEPETPAENEQEPSSAGNESSPLAQTVEESRPEPKDGGILTCGGLDFWLVLLESNGRAGESVRVHMPEGLDPDVAPNSLQTRLQGSGSLSISCGWDRTCTITNTTPHPVLLACEFTP